MNHRKDMVVGIKQTIRALESGKISQLFVADDADSYVTRPVEEFAALSGIPLEHVDSKRRLGGMCGIEIGAAVAGQLKQI